MKPLDKMLNLIRNTFALPQNTSEQLAHIVRSRVVESKPDSPWDLDTANEVKVVKAIVHVPPARIPLVEYLSSISDLEFSAHGSEMRYGETHYFRGRGTNIRATVVPTETISTVPRDYRKHDWFYVAVYCHPEDTRFDNFPGYEVVPAHQYKI